MISGNSGKNWIVNMIVNEAKIVVGHYEIICKIHEKNNKFIFMESTQTENGWDYFIGFVS